jgi:hypothetical protein
MALPRDEYLSSVWRDGIFGTMPLCPFTFQANGSLSFQKTRLSSVQAGRARSVLPRFELLSISAPMLALSDEMSRRPSPWPKI